MRYNMAQTKAQKKRAIEGRKKNTIRLSEIDTNKIRASSVYDRLSEFDRQSVLHDVIQPQCLFWVQRLDPEQDALVAQFPGFGVVVMRAACRTQHDERIGIQKSRNVAVAHQVKGH